MAVKHCSIKIFSALKGLVIMYVEGGGKNMLERSKFL